MSGPIIVAPMGSMAVMATGAHAGQGLVTTEEMEKMEKKEKMEQSDKMQLIST
jgi:NAD/NADP transhydrogenase alpha subunit